MCGVVLKGVGICVVVEGRCIPDPDLLLSWFHYFESFDPGRRMQTLAVVEDLLESS